ncbi:hypothetical protein V7O66_13955 [Methanolobus sp. ZRKC3]|uniref:hypothetical protein n=1 Tax=Methanolobus sp. ZRKC3 TaxID=3125786 RepID=UPI00324B5049
MVVKRNKEKVSIAMSPYLVKRAKALVESEEFGSVSDVLSTAFSQFLVKYENSASVAGCFGGAGLEQLADYFHSQEGKTLIRSIIQESLSSTSSSDVPIVIEEIIE